jgi:GAF domain-containing protein
VDTAERLFEMLLAGAGRPDFDALLEAGAAEALAAGLGEAGLAELRRQHSLALRVRDQMVHQASRESELSALNQTAIDLNEIRDLDRILTAIVQRARRLLGADMTYLSLNDEEHGASYMKVTDGALTPEFRRLRLPLGTGLLGLVAQDGAPYFTDDYQADTRFLHQGDIDDAVAAEQIRAILGVPLIGAGRVMGALLAVHRRVRPFPPREVALLGAFAAQAAVALESARLFGEAREALAALDAANERLQAQNDEIARAAAAHDRLTRVLTEGGDLEELAAVLAATLGADVEVYGEADQLLTPTARSVPADVRTATALAHSAAGSVRIAEGTWAARAAAAGEHLGTLVAMRGHDLTGAEQRTLERGAEVAAIVLLLRRTELEAVGRVRGELLTDLLARERLDPARLRDLARRHGVDLDARLAIAVARPADEADPEHRAHRWAAALAAEAGGLGAWYRDFVVVAAPLAPGDLGRLVTRRLPGATVGLAVCGRGAEGVSKGWREADQTLRALVALGRHGEVCAATDLGLTRLLLGHNGGAELEEFLTRTLGPLLEHEEKRGTELVETLQHWFATGGSLAETATQMHVHPNTIGQRLDRVGRLLGATWRNPERRVEVQIALRLHALREGGIEPTQ